MKVNPLPPLAEQLAQLLHGIESVPPREQRKMVRDAVLFVARHELGSIVQTDTDEAIVRYCDNAHARDTVYEHIRDWFLNNELFSGDQICQSDCFSDKDIRDLFIKLAEDVFQFDVDWKDGV